MPGRVVEVGARVHGHEDVLLADGDAGGLGAEVDLAVRLWIGRIGDVDEADRAGLGVRVHERLPVVGRVDDLGGAGASLRRTSNVPTWVKFSPPRFRAETGAATAVAISTDAAARPVRARAAGRKRIMSTPLSRFPTSGR